MALSLCVGLLIDDAIVVRENIVRHVQMGKSAHDAALDGTDEIGLAVLATTLSIVAVFLPIGFMGGIVGKFFHEFGITIVAAVLISMFVSFTLDPMLSSVWHDPATRRDGTPRPAGDAVRPDASAASPARFDALHALAGPTATSAILALVAAPQAGHAGHGAGHLRRPASRCMPLLGTEFVPKADFSETCINFYTPVGSSLEVTEASARGRSTRALRELPEVRYTVTTINTGLALGKNYGADLRAPGRPQGPPAQRRPDVGAAARAAGAIPGITVTNIGLLDRSAAQADPALDAGHRPARARAPVGAADAAAGRAIPGLVDLDSSSSPNKPTVAIDVKRDAASDVGLNVGALASALRTLVAGQTVGNWRADDDENYDVKVRLTPESRVTRRPTSSACRPDVGSNADGSPRIVRLSQVAEVRAVHAAPTRSTAAT